MNKKVGTISFHCQYNYGSALQAWALQTSVEKLDGYSCDQLNFYYEEDMKSNYDIRWKAGFVVLLLDLFTWFKNQKRKKAYLSFHKEFLHFTKQTKDWHDLSKIAFPYKYLIAGSDQIWNPCIVHTDAYFLPFANDEQIRISYAPSISIDRIPTDKEELFGKHLTHFKNISIREINCVEQLKKITGKDIECVLDPTMLLEPIDYEKLMQGYKIELPKNYIFVYCLHLSDLKTLVLTAKKIARKRNLKIVYFNKFDLPLGGKNIFKYDPRAFIYCIKNAKIVLSNSFHACVFSILYQKQFACLPVGGSESRLTTLFSKLKIEDRFIQKVDDEIPEIDYTVVNQHLSEHRKKSWDYLMNSLDYEG